MCFSRLQANSSYIPGSKKENHLHIEALMLLLALLELNEVFYLQLPPGCG